MSTSTLNAYGAGLGPGHSDWVSCLDVQKVHHAWTMVKSAPPEDLPSMVSTTRISVLPSLGPSGRLTSRCAQSRCRSAEGGKHSQAWRGLQVGLLLGLSSQPAVLVVESQPGSWPAALHAGPQLWHVHAPPLLPVKTINQVKTDI